MRVQTEEWRRFIPGVRMYKGKMTYFYNGELLYDVMTGRYLIYNYEERQKWEVIMVLPGVEVIPIGTFDGCRNVETVIMSDSVKRIENGAFYECNSLKFVRLSKTLEYIGDGAFCYCNSLTSIFIPNSCGEIGNGAFAYCYKLIIVRVPRHTTLGECVINLTALSTASPFETEKRLFFGGFIDGYYNRDISDEVNEWIKNLNRAEEFTLHRVCASIEPSEDNICEFIKQEGLPSLHVKNEIGVTALEYLEKNPYNNITEHKLMKRLVSDLVGETIA